MFPFYILTICKSEHIRIGVNKEKKWFFSVGAGTRLL